VITIEKVKEIIKQKSELKDLSNDYWNNDVFLSFNWWILLFLTIVPWIIWWKLVDRSRMIEILFYGASVSIYAILLDDIGSYFLLWIYEFQLVPISPRLNPIDLTVMPVTYMFVYQYFKRWKSFLLAQMVLAFGAAFLTEPIFVWLGIYKVLHWESIYSFVIYILLGAFNKWFVEKIIKLQNK
jgi:hypothetical protein